MGKFNRDDRSGSRGDFGQRDFGKRSFGDHGGRREMHKTVCSSCGKNCEVPFKPTGSKPVIATIVLEKTVVEMIQEDFRIEAQEGLILKEEMNQDHKTMNSLR